MREKMPAAWKRLSRVLAAATVVLWSAPWAQAQARTGVVSGHVRDASNRAIAATVVTARNVATGFRQSAVSDATGAYRLESLPAGRYDVTAERSGYATALTSGVALREGEVRALNFTLEFMAEAPEEARAAGADPPGRSQAQAAR